MKSIIFRLGIRSMGGTLFGRITLSRKTAHFNESSKYNSIKLVWDGDHLGITDTYINIAVLKSNGE